MKNNIFLEGKTFMAIGNNKKPDEYGYFGDCKFCHCNYAEPEIGYYECECELTGNTCCAAPCPMKAKYAVRKID